MSEIATNEAIDPYIKDGHLAVRSHALNLYDEKRRKVLPVRLSYPEPAGDYPIILVSHGAFGDRDGYQPLVEHWVSHGYFVIAPTHEDSMVYFAQERRQAARQQRISKREPEASELQAEARSTDERKNDLHDAFALFKKNAFKAWRNRPLDVSFVLNRLSLIAVEVPGLADIAGQKRVGIMGHSYGAHTAMILGGTVIGGSTEFKDDRIKSFVVMSPQGVEAGLDGSSPMDENSWANFNRPLLSITGTEDLGRNGEPHTWRFAPFLLSPPNDKYLLVIEGGHHGFGGVAGRRFEGAGPDNRKHVEWVRAACLAFWNAYLKQSEAACAFLQSDVLALASSGDVSVQHK